MNVSFPITGCHWGKPCEQACMAIMCISVHFAVSGRVFKTACSGYKLPSIGHLRAVSQIILINGNPIHVTVRGRAGSETFVKQGC